MGGTTKLKAKLYLILAWLMSLLFQQRRDLSGQWVLSIELRGHRAYVTQQLVTSQPQSVVTHKLII